MKATELRIGNLITYHKAIITVEGIVKNCIYHSGLCFDSGVESYQPFKPIPLTEEWLIKFWFRIGRKNYSLNSGRELHEYACTDYFIIWHNIQKGWCLNELPDSKQYYIQYVHQLQNLYFALTGEELQLNISNE